jgi:hypothetical protein
MYSHRLAVTTLALYGAGFLGTLGGLLTGEPHVVRYTALVAGAGAVTLLVNVVGVLAGRGDRAAAPARPPLVFPAGGKDLR